MHKQAKNGKKAQIVRAIPAPICQLFQIHGSELKLHPVCNPGQASMMRVSHRMFFFCIGKNSFYCLFSFGVDFFAQFSSSMADYLKSIDEWMRRRIRMVFWKKWKRVRTRWKNLLKLGVSNSNAGILACSRKGCWRIADSPVMKTALSNERLEKAGFRFFYSYYSKSVA